MTMGTVAAEKCDDFGWQPRGAIDPGLVADTMQNPYVGLGRAWSNSAGYSLAAGENLAYLVYTVEGGFDFTVDGESVETAASSLILLDGAAPTTARTLSETARFVWYVKPTILASGRGRFRFHEPIPMRNASLRALLALTNTVLNSPLPATGSARAHLGIAVEHLVAGALDEERASGGDDDAMHRDGLFMAAQLAIETHFRDPGLTVGRLARELSVSVRTVHDAFSRFGTTPRREVERRRVSEIDRLTDDARRSSSQTAEAVGFTSARQLNRAIARARPGTAHPAAERDER
ncbi:AraC family transcriptional regulator [Labedella gwakjiensis]|nr:helix-turn-helix domain-containing protein [Labedella gwakjiensis]PSL38109.1 AraC family transcriptional regulator [Labedella gwakjiensis]